jgi:hypothetical protein
MTFFLLQLACSGFGSTLLVLCSTPIISNYVCAGPCKMGENGDGGSKATYDGLNDTGHFVGYNL